MIANRFSNPQLSLRKARLPLPYACCVINGCRSEASHVHKPTAAQSRKTAQKGHTISGMCLVSPYSGCPSPILDRADCPTCEPEYMPRHYLSAYGRLCVVHGLHIGMVCRKCHFEVLYISHELLWLTRLQERHSLQRRPCRQALKAVRRALAARSQMAADAALPRATSESYNPSFCK